MKSNILEATFDTPKDGNVFFRAAGGCLIGRRDFMRMAKHHPDAIRLAEFFPRGLPSTLLRIDLNERRVTLVEPLRTDEWVPEREKLEKMKLPINQNVEYTSVHLADWLHELKRHVDAGYATIVKGELPKDLGEESKRAEKSPAEKSEDRIGRLCDVVEKLLESLPTLVKAAASK